MEDSGSIRCSNQRQNQMQWFCQVGALRLQGVLPLPPSSLVPSHSIGPTEGLSHQIYLGDPQLGYSIGKPLKPFKISKKASHEHLLNMLWKEGPSQGLRWTGCRTFYPTWSPPLYQCSQSSWIRSIITWKLRNAHSWATPQNY